MKKSDRNLLLAAGAAGVVAWLAYNGKNSPSVSGIPGVGALLPTSNFIPEKWRGQCSPLVADALVWGGAGLLLGKYGPKLF